MCNCKNGEGGACCKGNVLQEESSFGPVIFSYTRRMAIEDGTLIDVTKDAKEAGIKYPTAVSEALWSGYIEPTERLKSMGQSAGGRLWDALILFAVAAIASPKGCSELFYEVSFLMEKGSLYQHETVRIKAVCGPGDEGEPVVTLMLEEED